MECFAKLGGAVEANLGNQGREYLASKRYNKNRNDIQVHARWSIGEWNEERRYQASRRQRGGWENAVMQC